MHPRPPRTIPNSVGHRRSKRPQPPLHHVETRLHPLHMLPINLDPRPVHPVPGRIEVHPHQIHPPGTHLLHESQRHQERAPRPLVPQTVLLISRRPPLPTPPLPERRMVELLIPDKEAYMRSLMELLTSSPREGVGRGGKLEGLRGVPEFLREVVGLVPTNPPRTPHHPPTVVDAQSPPPNPLQEGRGNIQQRGAAPHQEHRLHPRNSYRFSPSPPDGPIPPPLEA